MEPTRFDEQPPPHLVAEPLPAVRRAFPAWGLLDILLLIGLIVASFFVSLIGLLVVMHIRGIPVQELERNPILGIPVQLVTYCVLLAFAFVLLRRRTGTTFREAIQWNMPSGVEISSLVLIGVGLGLLVQLASNYLPMPQEMPMQQYFRKASYVWVLTVFGIAIAPIVEEVFFRGLLYPALGVKIGMAAATAVTSLLFAGVHAAQYGSAWAPVLLMFLVSVAFTVARIRSQSLAAAWLMHVGYNAGLFVLLFVSTEGYRNLEKVAR